MAGPIAARYEGPSRLGAQKKMEKKTLTSLLRTAHGLLFPTGVGLRHRPSPPPSQDTMRSEPRVVPPAQRGRSLIGRGPRRARTHALSAHRSDWLAAAYRAFAAPVTFSMRPFVACTLQKFGSNVPSLPCVSGPRALELQLEIPSPRPLCPQQPQLPGAARPTRSQPQPQPKGEERERLGNLLTRS